jgi:hypothetical protein
MSFRVKQKHYPVGTPNRKKLIDQAVFQAKDASVKHLLKLCPSAIHLSFVRGWLMRYNQKALSR